MIQLEFNLENKSDVDVKMDYLETYIEKVDKKSDNVRRGLFARYNELAKLMLKQQQEIEQLKAYIAKQNSEQSWDYFKEGELFVSREV